MSELATRRRSTRSRALGYDDLPRLMALQTGDEKHDPAATSTLDVLWVLYDEVRTSVQNWSTSRSAIAST
jgi:hypothetical protein